jgi:hypothetical protein
VSARLSGLLGFLRPRPSSPALAPPPATVEAPPGIKLLTQPLATPEPALPPATRLTFHRVMTGRRNWLSTGHRQPDGSAFLVMEEQLDPARAVIAIVPDNNRQLCLIVAPDGGRIAVRSDGMQSIAISAVPLQHRDSRIVRLQHPCVPSRTMGVTMPGQGGPHGLVVFDSGGHTDLDIFDFVPMAEADVPAAVRFIAYEFARAATQPFTARGLLNALAAGAVRADLAEPLIRALRPDEASVLARDLLDQPQTLALLRDLLPANPWSHQVLPALAAWNRTRGPVPGGVIASPGSDEFAGRALEGHGMPQAGHILTALARSQVHPRRTACILTTMRNEGPHILDWVSYHLSIGFDHIFVYTNDNADGSDELLRTLARHGVLTLIENAAAPTLSPQHKAYSHALMLLPQILDYRWTALIDADEYIGFDTGMFRNIVDFITWQEAQPVDAIALCWLLHVAGRDDQWTPQTTLRRFPMRERGINAHVKSLFRTNMFWHSHPHFPHSALGRPFTFRTEGGRLHHLLNLTDRLAAFAETPSAEFAWVNHYIMRTAGEAVLKLARGRADQMGGESAWLQANIEHTARTFINLAQPQTMLRDERILACTTGQAETLARLMALPGVAECHDRIIASMPARLLEAARSFAAGVSPEGQSEVVRQFHAIIAKFAERAAQDS